MCIGSYMPGLCWIESIYDPGFLKCVQLLVFVHDRVSLIPSSDLQYLEGG